MSKSGASTAALYARAAASLNSPLSPQINWSTVFQVYVDTGRFSTQTKEEQLREIHQANYFLGSALHEHKHPDAKKYHNLSQPQKTAYRTKFRTWAESPHPHMKKHAAVWKTFTVLQVAANLGG